MLIMAEDGRLGNQVFQYAGLKSRARSQESIVLLGFRDLRSVFGNVEARIIPVSGHALHEGRKILCHFEPGVSLFRIARGWFQASSAADSSAALSLQVRGELIKAVQKRAQAAGIKLRESTVVHARGLDYRSWPSIGEAAFVPAQWSADQALKIGRPIVLIGDDEELLRELTGLLPEAINFSSNSYEDFVTLTLAGAGVISASSFAYWGARFALRDGAPGPFIAPEHWIGHPRGAWWPEGIQSSFLSYAPVVHSSRGFNDADSSSSLDRIVAVPQSGFANRIQTMASASILAEDLAASCSFVWVPFEKLPDGPEAIFSLDYVKHSFISVDSFTREFGGLASVPRYVASDAARSVVSLRGHDRGEQALLAETLRVLEETRSKSLVIVAGGSFSLSSGQNEWDETFLRRKQSYYRSLTFSDAITSVFHATITEHEEPFVALHLRYMDRSHQAPSDGTIVRALEQMRATSASRSMFVASDSAPARMKWMKKAAQMGFQPWTSSLEAGDRSRLGSVQSAVVDWLLLSSAQHVVFFAESSFATEAVIRGGTWDASHALSGSPLTLARHRLLSAGGRLSGRFRAL